MNDTNPVQANFETKMYSFSYDDPPMDKINESIPLSGIYFFAKNLRTNSAIIDAKFTPMTTNTTTVNTLVVNRMNTHSTTSPATTPTVTTAY